MEVEGGEKQGLQEEDQEGGEPKLGELRGVQIRGTNGRDKAVATHSIYIGTNLLPPPTSNVKIKEIFIPLPRHRSRCRSRRRCKKSAAASATPCCPSAAASTHQRCSVSSAAATRRRNLSSSTPGCSEYAMYMTDNRKHEAVRARQLLA
eukprot:1349836-Pleurochrysis_carterae.AAC.11